VSSPSLLPSTASLSAGSATDSAIACASASASARASLLFAALFFPFGDFGGVCAFPAPADRTAAGGGGSGAFSGPPVDPLFLPPDIEILVVLNLILIQLRWRVQILF
jgi:hypothetical protein